MDMHLEYCGDEIKEKQRQKRGKERRREGGESRISHKNGQTTNIYDMLNGIKSTLFHMK